MIISENTLSQQILTITLCQGISNAYITHYDTSY